MGLKKRLILSWSIPIILAISSSVIPFIPCKTGLSIPNSPTSWNLCKLDFVNFSLNNYIQTYFGLTSNPFIFGISAILILFVLLFWLTGYFSFLKK